MKVCASVQSPHGEPVSTSQSHRHSKGTQREGPGTPQKPRHNEPTRIPSRALTNTTQMPQVTPKVQDNQPQLVSHFQTPTNPESKRQPPQALSEKLTRINKRKTFKMTVNLLCSGRPSKFTPGSGDQCSEMRAPSKPLQASVSTLKTGWMNME